MLPDVPEESGKIEKWRSGKVRRKCNELARGLTVSSKIRAVFALHCSRHAAERPSGTHTTLCDGRRAVLSHVTVYQGGSGGRRPASKSGESRTQELSGGAAGPVARRVRSQARNRVRRGRRMRGLSGSTPRYQHQDRPGVDSGSARAGKHLCESGFNGEEEHTPQQGPPEQLVVLTQLVPLTTCPLQTYFSTSPLFHFSTFPREPDAVYTAP